MAITDNTVGYCSREQRFNGSQYGNSNGYRKQIFDGFPVKCRNSCFWKLCFDAETVAYGIDTSNSSIQFQAVNSYSYQNDGYQRAWNFFRELGSNGNDEYTDYTDNDIPPVYRIEVMEIKNPFSDKIARYFFTFKIKSENIGNLSGENGDGNTTSKTNDNRIRNKFDDCT